MKFVISCLGLILIGKASAANNHNCNVLLKRNNITQILEQNGAKDENFHSELIGLIKMLHGQNFISQADVEEMLVSVRDEGEIFNPLSSKREVKVEFLIFFETLDAFLKSTQLDRENFKSVLEAYLQTANSQYLEKQRINDDVSNLIAKMKFEKLPVGEMTIRNPRTNEPTTVRIGDGIEFHNSLVTQYQWVRVTGLPIPSYGIQESHPSPTPWLQVIQDIDGKNGSKIRVDSNAPAHTVSYGSVVGAVSERLREFITVKDQVLSYQESLRKIGNQNTHAIGFIQELNRLAEENDPKIYEIIIDHEPYHRYRVPTYYEWLYVASNFGENFGVSDVEVVPLIEWQVLPQVLTNPPLITKLFPVFDMFNSGVQYVEPPLGYGAEPASSALVGGGVKGNGITTHPKYTLERFTYNTAGVTHSSSVRLVRIDTRIREW